MSRSHFRTLTDALASAPPESPFITMWTDEDDVETVTFGEFHRLASLYAARLQANGVSRHDRVVLIMPQGIPLMAAFAGAMLSGAVPAILAYPNFKADPVKYSSGLAGVSANLDARLIAIDDAFPNELFDYLPKANETRIVRFADNPPTLNELPSHPSSPEPGDLAFIQHSAGTTGLQKGVALSHDAVLLQLGHLAAVLSLSDHDRIYSWLPLYHDMGLIACFILPLVYHLPVVMQSPVDWVLRPQTMLQLISEQRCSLSWIPNFALQFLARRIRPEDRAQYDLSSLRALINCSEPIRAQSMDEFRTAYAPYGLNPDALQTSYAMAENVFAVTQSAPQGPPRRLWIDQRTLSAAGRAVPVERDARGSTCLVSSGQCLECNHVRIVSSSGEDSADGEVGEIAIQSDSLFDGYFNRPDLTAKVFTGGWYRSGDLGFRLDGELYVIGRQKDLIITAGKNIHPQDIEEIACRHAAIHDGRAVALGVYNEDLGTEVIIVAAEVETEAELEHSLQIEREVRDAIVAELDIAVRHVYLKPPRWIVKSTAGKPARSTTREKLSVEHPELVHQS